ncbi:hypothetical protein QUA56_29970 [Microcoleus sp. N3A4]|uniref:hypothetical protein n=1 Tax=Microcoleus sp. N3A4 TaxID=3055379 RepID=UPI002FD3F0DA
MLILSLRFWHWALSRRLGNGRSRGSIEISSIALQFCDCSGLSRSLMANDC